MSESLCKKFALFGDQSVTSLNHQNVDPRDFKVLQRIPICPKGPLKLDKLEEGLPFTLPLQFSEPLPAEQLCTLILLDTETTGLDFHEDEMIELGMVKVIYSKSRNLILSLEGIYDELNEPGKPVNAQITKLTGITNEELQGKAFSLDKISAFVSNCNLIVAHNAKFDRPFFEKTFPELRNKNWACTLQEIDWQLHFDMPSSKLGLMAQERGFFFDAHRAISDCLALLWLLLLTPEAFSELLSRARQKSYDLKLLGNTYDIKDELKSKFQARFKDKTWYIFDLEETRLAEFQAFLEAKQEAGLNVDYMKLEKTARQRYQL